MRNKAITFQMILLLGYINKDALACSVICEDGKVPCGSYDSTCAGFQGCKYPHECSGSGGQNNGGDLSTIGPSFNTKPTKPIIPTNPIISTYPWQQPQNQGSTLNWGQQQNNFWQRPTYPNHQRPTYKPLHENNNGNGIVA